MKSEPKAFASLSSGLLARKGAARPAMRPQGFGQGVAGLEDLGWNDMGFEPPKPAETPERDADHDAFGEEIAEHPQRNPLAGLTPVELPVHGQQAEIAGRLSAFAPGDEGEEDETDETAELEAEADDAVDFDEPEAEPVAVASVTKSKPVAIAPVAEARPVVRSVPAPTPSVGGKAKAAFTLRLDPQRHLKLRLACAVSGQSAQMLVTQAARPAA